MRFPWTKSITASPAVVEALRDRTSSMLIPLGGTNVQAINAAFMRGQSATYGFMYATRPPVRMVVDYIAKNIGQLPLKLYERVGDEDRSRDYNHPAAETMEYPSGEGNPDGTPAKLFIRAVVTDFLIYDRACILKFRRDDRGGPRTLVRVPPTMVLPAGGRFNTDYYRVYRTDGSFFDVPPEDVIHWHGYNPDDALVGLSKLETLRDSLTEDATSQAAVVELMKAGLKGGHIERPLEAPDFSPEARERFLESWRAGGVSHLDRVLEEGMHWVPTAMTPKDAELLASRNRTVDEVAAVYGCPADLFRSAAGADGELEEARKQFYADTLPPLTEELGEQFDQDILVTEYGDSDRYFEFDLNEKLRGDPIQRFAAITTTTGRPWRTVNEARALEGMGPIDGGDELTIPLNVALGELPAPNVMPIQDPNKPPQDGSHREPPGGAAPPKSLAVKADPPVLHLVERHKSDLRRQKRYIGEALAVMERFYTRQARALRRKAQDFDMERWDRELADDLNGLLASIVEREGGLYVARLAGDDFDMRQVDHYIRETAVGVATAINEVTLADIEEQGLEDAMARARDERASVAATSLGARATIFARTEAAKQSPDYELRKMTWVPNTARHADFGGVTVGVEDGWPGGFAPGSAPNCACTASIA